MRGRSPALHYQVVPGSGDGELEGLSGTFHFTVEDDGAHRYELEYDPCATARPRDRATSRPRARPTGITRAPSQNGSASGIDQDDQAEGASSACTVR